MGVLTETDHDDVHTEHVPKTIFFTELENMNDLQYTDSAQYTDTAQRRTVDYFSLYQWCKDNDQGTVIEQTEQLHTEQLTETAYKARVTSIYTGLHNFSNPTGHTRHMLILRALTFSTDPTTQSRTAKMLKAYMATPQDQVKGLREHVRQHGTPPAVPGVEDMASIAGSPGIELESSAWGQSRGHRSTRHA